MGKASVRVTLRGRVRLRSGLVRVMLIGARKGLLDILRVKVQVRARDNHPQASDVSPRGTTVFATVFYKISKFNGTIRPWVQTLGSRLQLNVVVMSIANLLAKNIERVSKNYNRRQTLWFERRATVWITNAFNMTIRERELCWTRGREF